MLQGALKDQLAALLTAHQDRRLQLWLRRTLPQHPQAVSQRPHVPLRTLSQGIDLDPLVIEHYQTHYATELTEEQQKRITLTNANFTSLPSIKVFPKFDVVLADFGFNSFHLETERGFTWQREEELDMRYSSSSMRCSDLVLLPLPRLTVPVSLS